MPLEQEPLTLILDINLSTLKKIKIKILVSQFFITTLRPEGATFDDFNQTKDHSSDDDMSQQSCH